MSIRPDGQPDGQTRMKARCLGGGTPDGEGTCHTRQAAADERTVVPPAARPDVRSRQRDHHPQLTLAMDSQASHLFTEDCTDYYESWDKKY
jgi:hypothetical protein